MKQLYIIFIISVAFYLPSCTNLVNSNTELFKITVDSIQAPVSIGHTDTLNIKFWGLVGPNGCYSFSHFEIKQTTSDISITVWGKHRKDDVCPQVLVYLDGKDCKFVPPDNSDSIKIIVYQPNDSSITKTVAINYPPPTIFGRWSWVITNSPDFPDLTPAITGYSIFYDFNVDSTFEAFKNDSSIYSGTYSIRRERGPLMADSGDVLRIGPQWFRGGNVFNLTYLHRDTIKLRQLAFDVPTEIFSRMK